MLTGMTAAPKKAGKRKSRLTQDIRIPARTSAEILERFEALRSRARSLGLKFEGRVISSEATLSAILAWFLDLSLEEQAKIVQENLPRFDASLDGVPLDTRRPNPNPAAANLTAHHQGKPARRTKGA
jgi:hypothetical protein